MQLVSMEKKYPAHSKDYGDSIKVYRAILPFSFLVLISNGQEMSKEASL